MGVLLGGGFYKGIYGRGHFQLPEAFYRMTIGPPLAEIWPKREILSQGTHQQTEGGAFIGEFTVVTNTKLATIYQIFSSSPVLIDYVIYMCI